MCCSSSDESQRDSGDSEYDNDRRRSDDEEMKGKQQTSEDKENRSRSGPKKQPRRTHVANLLPWRSPLAHDYMKRLSEFYLTGRSSAAKAICFRKMQGNYVVLAC